MTTIDCSAYINKLKFGHVRLLSDICSLSCFLASVVFYTRKLSHFISDACAAVDDRWLIDVEYQLPEAPSVTANAVALDLFGFGIFPLLIQFADNYIFYIRYAAITRVSSPKKIAIHVYIVLVLFLTWIPAYTIVPFFYDVNSPKFLEVFGWSLQFYTWGAFVYNVVFVYQYIEILYKVHFGGATQFSRAVTILCYKTLAHFAIRCRPITFLLRAHCLIISVNVAQLLLSFTRISTRR